MSGDPKTLTLTLEEAAEHISHNVESEYGTELSLARTREGWVILYWLGNGTAAYALSAPPRAHWDDAVRDAGVPVVARDEAAELRAALAELRSAVQAHFNPPYMDGSHIPVRLRKPLADAQDAIYGPEPDRRLAGGENEK